MWPFGGWKRFRRKLRRLWRLGDEHESVDLEELADKSPTTKYVNLLLLEMIRSEIDELTLNTSSPLPQSRLVPEAEIPAFESVVSRLKVMAGLDAVIYHQPKEGRIEPIIGASHVVLHVRFDDMAPDRSVHLRLEWLDEPPPPGSLA